MDAFIDTRQGAGTTYTPNGGIALENASLNNASNSESAAASQGGSELAITVDTPALNETAAVRNDSPSSSGSSPDEGMAVTSGSTLNHGDGTDPKGDQAASNYEDKPKEGQKQQAQQQDSKHKQKKKKKKKGRKTPPLPKSKQGTLSNGPSEEKIENEAAPSSNTGKPPLPPTGAAPESQASTDQPGAVQAEPSPAAPAAATTQEQSKPTPATTTPTENVKEMSAEVTKPEATPPPAVQKPSEKVVEKAPLVSAPAAEQKPVVAAAAEPPKEDKKPDTAAVPTTATKSQNQSVPEGGSAPKPTGPAEAEVKAPLNGVPSSESPALTVSAPAESKDKTEKPSPQTPVNDENTPPPKDSTPAPPPAKEGQLDGETPASQPTEKSDDSDKKDVKDSKLQYDRAYLMELRECRSSQTKPEGLPNLEIILDRPMNRGVVGTSPDFTPNFFQPSTPQRQHPQQMGKSTSRGRGRPGDMQMPQRIIKSVSIQNDVKILHQSEKPWKPSQKKLASGEINAKVDNLESKSLFIMNRLTPTNFEALSAEMLALKIEDYERLQQLVKIIFDKVTIETKFVEAYAKLCKKMCTLKVPPPPGMKDNQATFRVLLLTKCQTEFESDKAVVFEDPEDKRKKLEAELPEGPEKKEEIEKILYHMKLRRLNFFGNIRFIGELFKLSLLTENIMHDCIFRLLKARDDESLVSLCQLISTVGSILDTDKAKTRMDQYFVQMTKIAEERKSRIKFTLKDAIDLRRNHWVPRKEQTGPKKIEEVRQEFHQEQQTKQYLQNQPPPPRNDPQPSSRRGSRQRQQEEKPADDGWNTVGNKSMKLDASKMKLSRTVVDENSIQLGPGGGMNKFAMWGKGSGASQPMMDSPNRPSNRYSALTNDEDRRFQRSPSRGDGGVVNRGLRQGNTAGHGRGKIGGRSSMEGERRDALNSARSIVAGRSQNSSRDNSWNRDDRRSFGPRGSREGESMGPPRTISLRPSTERSHAPPAPAAPTVVPGFGTVKRAAPKTEEEMEQTAKTIMDEYLNIRDLKEAKLCIMELEGQTYLHSFITASINNVLERSDKDRTATGQFFYEIVKDNLISLEKFTKGLSAVLEFAEDMVIDIPKMWTNLAQLIAPTLIGGCLPWSQLKPVMEPYLTPMCSAKLLAEILLFAKSITSEGEVARMWQTSGLTWEAFLPSDRLADFIKDRKLEFLQEPAKDPPASSSAGGSGASSGTANNDRLVEDLAKVIRDAKPNPEIYAFIKDNVPHDIDEKSFVRMLMTAVCKASLSATMKPNVEVITKRQEVLQKYIKSPELELQALYAIQALMHRLEHPKGVITTVFETLYNEEMINEEALKAWEISKEEEEGKGPCLLQLRQFFTWLRENEDIETS